MQGLLDWPSLVALASTLLAWLFAAAVLRRYVARPTHTHLLLWAIGLAVYGTATFAELYSSLTWSAAVFRLWYFCGALMGAAWLGQGTVFLLAGQRFARATLVLLLVASVVAGLLLVKTPLPGAAAFEPSTPLSFQYKSVLPQGTPVRSLTPLFNIYGAAALIGGALYSAILFWRRRAAPWRVAGNATIAAGALMPATGGLLARLGQPGFLYLSELLGVGLMFVGFGLATRASGRPIVQ